MPEFTSMFNEYGVPNDKGDYIESIVCSLMSELLSTDIHPLNIIEMEHIIHTTVTTACVIATIKAQTKMRKTK